MKSSHPAESARSASTQYAPSVPMTVYRELAAELRANKAVIDSLNSRNQQLLQQNQMLKQEIHNVVQASMSLGRAAGIATPPDHSMTNFPSAIAPDTLAKLVRDERSHPEPLDYYAQPEALAAPPMPVPITPDYSTRAVDRSVSEPLEERDSQPNFQPNLQSNLQRSPQRNAAKRTTPVAKKAKKPSSASRSPAPKNAASKSSAPKHRGIDQNLEKIAKRQKAARQAAARNEAQHRVPKAASLATQMPSMKAQAPKKLFTEQIGEYRNAADLEESKEIGGIWLVLSIILIIVTAFGAGFLIMKPLLGDR